MYPKFEIESMFNILGRDQVCVTAKRLDDLYFKMSDNSTLNDIPIENFTDIPRAHDNDGNIRYDLFVFMLKDKDDKEKLVKGQIVELVT